MKRLFTILMTLSVLGVQAQTIPGFVAGLHTGGSTITTTATFPTDLSNISQILMHVSLDCPVGGCDPWDRFAVLYVEHNGENIEIGRYVTPYGNDWCDWTIDVTDYRGYLSGTRTLVSHIETWQNGWLVNTEFEFISGTPTYEYVGVQELWFDHQFTYGDTIFYSIDLPEQTVDIPSNAEQVIYRMINTGHGQGNTENAAEFSQKTHEIVVNGNTEFTQFLWKSDCGQNPCSPQGGTWQYDRAGWCPGQNVEPDDFDITSMVTAGGSATVDYVLEPFFNECSPWNVDCEDGITCTECTYNSNGHTTPVYKITGQLIIKSSSPLSIGIDEVEQPASLELYPNPSTGTLNIQLNSRAEMDATITDLNGRVLKEFSFDNAFQQIDVSELADGIYLLHLKNDDSYLTEKFIVKDQE